MVDETASIVDKNGVQVIARAASILRALEDEPEGLSLGELAKKLGLARSTVQRLVGALAEEQLLMSAGRSGVTLGPALVRLAAAANIDTERLVRPILQAVSRDLGETVDLSTLRGRSAAFVDQVMGTSRLVAVSAVGEAFPLHCTANGKALLASVTPERRKSLLDGRLPRAAGKAVLDRAALEQEIGDVAALGLAYDLEEHSEGICAIGIAFIDPIGREYALSVPVPTARFEAKRDRIADRLLQARDEILKTIMGARASRGD